MTEKRKEYEWVSPLVYVWRIPHTKRRISLKNLIHEVEKNNWECFSLDQLELATQLLWKLYRGFVYNFLKQLVFYGPTQHFYSQHTQDLMRPSLVVWQFLNMLTSKSMGLWMKKKLFCGMISEFSLLVKYHSWRIQNWKQLDNRLKEIKDRSKGFGGISIVFVGDFRQLKPIQS